MKTERTVALTAQRVLALLISVFAMALCVACGSGGAGSSGNNAITVSLPSRLRIRLWPAARPLPLPYRSATILRMPV